jgi:hypothetical protein
MEFITKKEVIQAIDSLDEKKDIDLLSKIYNNVKMVDIRSLFDNALKTTLSNLDKSQIENYKNIFMLHGLDAPFAAINQYFHLLNTQRFGSAAFQKQSAGDLPQLVGPELASNEVFKKTLPYIVASSKGTAAGYGKGELFFMVYGKDAKKIASKEHADVSVDGWKIEVKGKGAALNPGQDTTQKQNVNIVDTLNDGLRQIANQENITLLQKSEKTNPTNPVGGWFPDFFKQLTEKKGEAFALTTLRDYLSKLYRLKNADEFAKAVFPLLGTRECNRVWASYVINSAKAQSNWQSTIIVDTDGNSNFGFVNIVDGSSLPDSLNFKPVLSKGSGTYAYPDGAIMVGLNQDVDDKKVKISSFKEELAGLQREWATIKQNKTVDKRFNKVEKLLAALDSRINKLSHTKAVRSMGLERMLSELDSLMFDIKNVSGSNRGYKPKQPKQPKQATPVKQPKEDPAVAAQQLAAKQELNNAKQTFDSYLQLKPEFRQAYNKIDNLDKLGAQEEAVDLIKSGASFEQVMDLLGQHVMESTNKKENKQYLGELNKLKSFIKELNK